MNKTNILLHKGTDNELRFRVFNQDRKPVKVNHLGGIAVKLVNPQNGEPVLNKLASISPEKGFFQLRVTEGELVNIAPGYYTMTVLGQESLVPGLDPELYRTPFYTDTGSSIVSTVQVVESADRTPAPSFVIEENDWRTIKNSAGRTFYRDINELHTSAIAGSRVRNHTNALHTFAVFAENYTGSLQIMATLDLQPPEKPEHWFPVDLTSGTNIAEFYEYTGSISFTFAANFMWLTFVQRPGYLPEESDLGPIPLDVGKITKIILR